MADQASEGNARTSPEESPLLVAEYVSLRTEIVKRIELRQQYVTISLAIAGAFLGASVAFSSSPVALIFPLLAPFLAIGWVQNDLRVWDVAQYIRERYERPGSGLGWETRAQNEREAQQPVATRRCLAWWRAGIHAGPGGGTRLDGCPVPPESRALRVAGFGRRRDRGCRRCAATGDAEEVRPRNSPTELPVERPEHYPLVADVHILKEENKWL